MVSFILWFIFVIYFDNGGVADNNGCCVAAFVGILL